MSQRRTSVPASRVLRMLPWHQATRRDRKFQLGTRPAGDDLLLQTSFATPVWSSVGSRPPSTHMEGGLAPVTSLTWNCLSNDSGSQPASISHRTCTGRGVSNGCGDATYEAPSDLACEAPPGCPHMPVGSCETSGNPLNLDCTLDCPANYKVNNSPQTALPYTLQCLLFDLPSSDFETACADPRCRRQQVDSTAVATWCVRSPLEASWVVLRVAQRGFDDVYSRLQRIP